MSAAELAREGRRILVSFDPVWGVFGLVFAVLAAVAPDQAVASARSVVASLVHIAPYLLLAVLAAAYAAATSADHLIARAFKGRIVAMVGLAALVGAFSPFCSCGVIPLIAALLSMGVPLAPVMAFWLSSPVMDPTMFAITAGELGLQFAVAKALFAVMIGLIGGFGVLVLARTSFMVDPLRESVGSGGCCGASVRSSDDVVWRFWGDPARRERFAGEATRTLMFLVKWLSIAYLLESLFLTWVPSEQIAGTLGSDSIWVLFGAAVIGAPLYLNGYAAVPVASGLVEAGMFPGAAMAFLIGGGVTSIPAAIAVYALVKRRIFALYLGFSLIGAISSGLLYQLWLAL